MLTIDLREALDAAMGRLEQKLVAAVKEAVAAAMRDRLVTVEEAADLMGCTPAALRKRIARGHLPVRRAGRSVRVRLGDLMGSR